MTGSIRGTMIAVVGPSGAGKDSLIDFARRSLAGNDGIAFVRRFITRDADAGSEDHHAVSVAEFEAMRDAGRFAVHWGAHDLHYGIPADTLAALADGKTLIANGSRAAIADFHKAYGKLLVVAVTADPAVIAARLKTRGRENDASIARRLARAQQDWHVDCCAAVIDNSGALAVAGAEFVKLILQTARGSAPQSA
jgi:ribose 1,5-bisphosphokinase